MAVEVALWTLLTCPGKRACVTREARHFIYWSSEKMQLEAERDGWGYCIYQEPCRETAAEVMATPTAALADTLQLSLGNYYWPYDFQRPEIVWIELLARRLAMWSMSNPVMFVPTCGNYYETRIDEKKPVTIFFHDPPNQHYPILHDGDDVMCV